MRTVGFRLEGEEGLLRDAAIFSVIAAEWPHCRAKPEARLAGYAPDAPPAQPPAFGPADGFLR
jgi:hypothetical protein